MYSCNGQLIFHLKNKGLFITRDVLEYLEVYLIHYNNDKNTFLQIMCVCMDVFKGVT